MKSFRMKSAFNILTKQYLYANCKRESYIADDNVKDLPLVLTDTKIRNEIWSCLKDIVDLSIWEIGEGDFSFWFKNWTGKGCWLI